MSALRLKTQILGILGVYLLTFFLTACKSDVEDKTDQSTRSVMNVDSIKISSQQNIGNNTSKNAVIDKKYYSITACLSENSLGQKLDRRKVEAEGTPLLNEYTDASGCIFWEHTFNFDYTGVNRCQVLTQVIKIPNSNLTKTLNYAIDTLNDEVVDLERSKGCTIYDEQNVTTSMKDNGGELILEDINLYWTGEQEEKRSDVKYLTYRTKIDSCLKSRISNAALSDTPISISIYDRSQLHDPIIMEDVVTDESGCFERQFSSPYEQFGYSHWLEKDVVIRVLQGPLKGSNIETMVYINPYEVSRTFFGIDSRRDSPMENPIPRNNRIHIDGVMYIQIGNDIENFKVNDYLGLTVSKSYQVVLNPRIDRGHRFTKDSDRYAKMHDGRFRLKFMILAPNKADIEISENNYQDFEYITGAEKIVEVKDGVVNSLISIPVKLTDLPRLATRTVSVFKLEPITDTGIISTTVTGFFKAKIAWIKTNVMQSEVLQSSEAELSYQVDKNDMKSEAESVASQIEDNIDQAIEDLIEPDELSDILNEEMANITDENKLNYKRKIEELFANINKTEKEEIYGNPKVFADDSAKEIFKRHLAKQFPNIVHEATGSSEAQEESVESTQEKKKFNLPEGIINDLYTKLDEGTLDTANDKRYQAIMSLICRNAFPKPEKKEGFFSNLFSSDENPEYSRCVRNPSQFFELSKFMHSKQITKTEPAYSNGFNMNIGSRFSTSYGENTSQYLSKRVGADLGLKLPLGEYFGAGVKLFDVSYTWSEGSSENQNWSDDVSSSKNLVIEKFMVDVTGKFEKCVLFQGKDYISTASMMALGYAGGMGAVPITVGRTMNAYQEKLDKQYYLCDKPTADKVSEPWYYIQAYVPSATLLRDAYGPTEIKLIKVLRGESTFNEFKKLFEDETKVYLVEDTSASETPDQKLYQNWGHLLKDTPPPSVANKLLIENFEGAFPGTIQ